MRRVAAAAATLVWLLPAAAGAEADATDVVAGEIEVRLAEIEVVVTDRQGIPVAGLESDDFELLQDGRRVELTHFQAVGGRTGSPGAAAAAAAGTSPPAGARGPAAEPAAPLHLVVYLDRGYLELGDLRDVREALKSFLRQALAPGDRVMLVAADGALEVAQGFTSVPELVVSQIDDVRERPGGGRLARESQSILTDMRRVKSEGNDLAARDPRHMARAFVARIQAYAAEVDGELQRTTSQLAQLTGSLAGLPGRRVVIYVGGRLPAAYVRQLFEVWGDSFGRHSNLQIPDLPDANNPGAGDGGGQGQAAAADPVFDSIAAASSSFEIDAGRRVREVARLASASGVVFHTVDASGLRGSAALFAAPGDATLGARGATSPSSSAAAPGSLADALGPLRALALDTGGRAFSGSRDFRGALAAIGSDLETYYSLGFEPLPADGGRSKIEVRLASDRPGSGRLKVRHRPILELKDRDTLAAERTISALLLEEMENPLAVEVAAGEPAAAPRGAFKVPVSVTVPLARLALVADGRVHAGRLSIYATSGGLDRVGAVVKAVVPVRIANQDLLTSLGRRVAYRLELTLPGPERIAVTVRDDFRPRWSTAIATFGGSVAPGVGRGSE